MTSPWPWLIRRLLTLIPARWRESVSRDLGEEAARLGRRPLWQVWHVLAIAATLRFGRETRPERHHAWMSGFANLGSDLTLAVRSIRSRPWSTAAIVVTLALGVGASTAVFAVFNYALFRPVPGIADEASLVSLRVRPNLESRTETGATFAHLAAMRDMPAFAGLATSWSQSYPTTLGAAEPRMVRVTGVSRDYFSILGATPALGRLFSLEEYETPDTMLAVISERLWNTAGRDPRIIGTSFHIINRSFIVIGVVRDFRGLSRVGSDDLWVPIGATAALTGRSEISAQRMIGRLAPDATLAAARAQAVAAFERVGVITVQEQRYTAVASPGLSDGINQSQTRTRELFWMAAGGSGLLLLLACTNGAGLLLTRNLGRARDAALKSALGADRLRLFRELLVELLAVGVLAALTGLGVAALLTEFFRSLTLASYMPPLENLSFDWRVALFAAAAGLTTVCLAGLFPSLLGSRINPQAGLRDVARSHSRAGVVRHGLIVVQVALSLTLVAGAAVLGLSVHKLQSVELGFETHRLYALDLRPRDVGRDPARPFLDEVERRLSTTPGVEAAAYAQFHHIGPRSTTQVQLRPDGSPVLVIERAVSADYFRTLGIPLLAGRMLTASEVAAPSTVSPVLIDELLARRMFGGSSPLGRHLYTTFPSMHQREIVRVVGSTGSNALREDRLPGIYSAPGDLRIATMFIRSALPPAEAGAVFRRVVREVEPRLAPGTVSTPAAIVRNLSAEERVLARVGLVLSLIGLGLAMSGIYATMAFSTHERTREFGIRMALGASAHSVGRGVLRQTGGVTVLGLVVGLAMYGWASRFLEAKLFGISTLDPLLLVGACAALLASALVAAAVPARRATRVDPATALRAE